MPLQQKSVVLIKPDALQRGLVGKIISRFEQKGLKLLGIKMMFLTDELLEKWYVHHKDKPFFGDLKSFMQSTPVIAMLWEGLDCSVTERKENSLRCGLLRCRSSFLPVLPCVFPFLPLTARSSNHENLSCFAYRGPKGPSLFPLAPNTLKVFVP